MQVVPSVLLLENDLTPNPERQPLNECKAMQTRVQSASAAIRHNIPA